MVINKVLGNAGEIDKNQVQEEYEHFLIEGEKVQKAYKLIRDMFIFTNKRLILIDKQGLTGKKQDYHSIPYKSISHFTIETAGHFDLDAELKIYISGNMTPIQKKFNKKLSIYEVEKVLSKHIL